MTSQADPSEGRILFHFWQLHVCKRIQASRNLTKPRAEWEDLRLTGANNLSRSLCLNLLML